eukprot:gene19552-25451_t
MVIIGLTGGICSGKSTVSKLLIDYGANYIDADKLGHEAYLPGTNCYYNLVNEFEKLNKLQSIVWPEIRSLAYNKIKLTQSDISNSNKHIVLEAAVMIEAGWQDLVDTLWVVETDKQLALRRLQIRNNITSEEALKIIESQLSNEERRKYANKLIINNGDANELEKQCIELWSQL